MKTILLITLLIAFMTTGVLAETTYTLKFDPFAKIINTSRAVVKSSGTEPTTPKNNQSNWTAKVNSIIQAGKNSMANIDGNIISLNEQYKGYTLIKIEKQSVIFQKGSHRITLGLDNNE